MPFVTFEEIRPLIDSADPVHGGMKVYFKCPKSGRVVESRASFPDSGRRRFAQVTTGSTARALLHQLSGFIRRLTGIYIPLGNAFQVHDVPGGGNGFVNESDRQGAAIAAFELIAEYPGKPPKRERFNFIDNQWQFID